MATITVNQYNDDGTTARADGETLTINGATFTQRTDTRWFSGAPAGMVAGYAAITLSATLGGRYVVDATQVRWLAFNNGTGNVPAIGTNLTQAGVSASYLLAVYASLTAAPTLAGAVMPGTGFMKFRSVTGTFAAGAITGIGALANGPDVTGWLEITMDQAGTITVPRLAEFETRGSWFYLDNTNGSVGQVLQIPTNNGGVGTHCPGLWVESMTPIAISAITWATGVAAIESGGGVPLRVGQYVLIEGVTPSTYNGERRILSVTDDGDFFTVAIAADPGVYTSGGTFSNFDLFPALLDASNGWRFDHIGSPNTNGAYADERQQFVKTLGSGQLQIGEAVTITGATYTTKTQAGTYAVTSSVCTVTFTAHGMRPNDQVYCDFTTGGATGSDGAYTILTVPTANTYTFALAIANTSGNVTLTPYSVISTLAVHNLAVRNRVYINATSGGLADGVYDVVSVGAAQASTYTWVANVVTVTFAGHNVLVGDKVYVDFTSGGGTPDGLYTVASVTSTSIYTFALTGSGTAGNATVTPRTFQIRSAIAASTGDCEILMTVGYVPPTGRRTRVPNIFMRQNAAATPAVNAAPNATITSRPEFLTTSAGNIDVEYCYNDWYWNLLQPYSVRMYHCATFDSILLQECATAVDLDDFGTGMHGAQDLNTLNFASNFAGGYVRNAKLERGNAPSTTDHAIFLQYCIGTEFVNVRAGIIQYARSTGYSLQITYCTNITFRGCEWLNNATVVTAGADIEFYDCDYCERYTGWTGGGGYMVSATGTQGLVMDGVTFGLGGAVAEVQPYAGILYYLACADVTLRNAGEPAALLDVGQWPTYAMGLMWVSGGNNANMRQQRLYVQPRLRSGWATAINSDKGESTDNVRAAGYMPTTGIATSLTYVPVTLNARARGIRPTNHTTTGQTSVYGTHFSDYFTADTTGAIMYIANEPTAETLQYTALFVQGIGGYTSSGGVTLQSVDDYVEVETDYWIKGHTAFQNVAITVTGTNTGNHYYAYKIDTGSGWSDWKQATGANLSSEVISAITGFRLRVRVKCTAASTTNLISFVRIDTHTTASAQVDNEYPLDQVYVTLTNIVAGSKYRIQQADGTLLAQGTATSTIERVLVTYSGTDETITIRVRNSTPGAARYVAFQTNALLTLDGADVYILQARDMVA